MHSTQNGSPDKKTNKPLNTALGRPIKVDELNVPFYCLIVYDVAFN